MASPNKRPHLESDSRKNVVNGDPNTPPDSTESSSDEDFYNSDDDEVSENETGEDGSDQGNNGDAPHEIQVEFEARTPEDCDYHGVRRLLCKLFNVRPDAVDLSKMAETIIGQRIVGSVITQSKEEDDDDLSDEEEFEDLNNEVFGVTTVLKLTGDIPGQPSEAADLAKQIKKYLVDIAKKEGDSIEKLTSFLGNPRHTVGFLISERIMNIPPQISRPLYETLFNEIKKAKSKRMPYDFTHFILVARCLKPSSGGTLIYVNAEEEMLEEESLFVVEADCQGAAPSVSGSGDDKKVVDLNESEYENVSKILVLDAAKCDRYLEMLNNLFPI